jgi:adenosine deaminase
MTPIPKAELHLHLEGTLEPEFAFELAERNHIDFPYATVGELRAAYSFSDLQSFLDVHYANMSVLRTERDYAELAAAYLARAREQGVRHAEIFFDPQLSTGRGVSVDTVLAGYGSVLRRSQQDYGISAGLIMCFLRDRTVESALADFEAARPWFGDLIIGVGLDSTELGNPPAKFREVFELAGQAGLHRVAHAGEEGPPEYVWEALDVLKVERIDHGIRSLEDPRLVERLRRDQIGLTVCPLSNVYLRCVDRLEDHPLPAMLASGLLAMVNSDDPPYFGGYVEDNFAAIRVALKLTDEQVRTLAANSFKASFLSLDQRAAYLKEVADHIF